VPEGKKKWGLGVWAGEYMGGLRARDSEGSIGGSKKGVGGIY